MGEGGVALLAHWESFYVITGAAAATLTGLQFIVITLSARMNRSNAESNRAFVTPTIVHFCAVLFIAALLSAPWTALVGVAFVLGVCGVAGLVYAAVILRIVLRAVLGQSTYKLVLEDWVCHFTLPPIAYAILLVAALMLQSSPTIALFLVSGTVLLLLFVGIHNAWDIGTFIILYRRSEEEQRKNKK